MTTSKDQPSTVVGDSNDDPSRPRKEHGSCLEEGKFKAKRGASGTNREETLENSLTLKGKVPKG